MKVFLLRLSNSLLAPKSQEDVDNRKRELEEKIRGLGGTVSAEYPLRGISFCQLPSL